MNFDNILWADFETRSGNPITSGAHVYAEDSEVIMAQYALGEGAVQVWDAGNGQPLPADLHAYFSNPSIILAFHNQDFDRTQMLTWDWCKGYDLNPMRFFCTMTAARMAGLPGGLEDLCAALGLEEKYAKKDGKALIMFFCVPRKDGQYNQPWEHPEKWAKFIEYGVHDIVAMREAMRRIPHVFNETERVYYAYTTVMNDRGIYIDRELASAGRLQADALKDRYKAQGRALVSEDFNLVSQKALLEFLASYGVKLDNARSATLEAFLESDQAALVPQVVRTVLATRLKTNKASVTKLAAIMKGVNRDGRVRGTIGFYGAQRTGRDAGRRIQPQNLSRPVLLRGPNPAKGDPGLSMEDAVKIVKDGTAELFFEDPLQLISDTVRGVICVPPGCRMPVADLSNIEGRVCPWLSNEEWKLQYFRDFDGGKIKFDNYIMAYANSFNVPPEQVNKEGRSIGKVQELASQFGGAVGAYITFATAFRLDVEAMGLGIARNADPYLVQDCRNSFSWFEEKKLTYGLSIDVWSGIQAGVKAWRNSHSMIVAGWKKAEDAFRNAIRNPGISFEAARGVYIQNNGWGNFVQLPSGRTLVYPQAREVDQGRRATGLAFTSVNPFNRKWSTIYTTGPKLIENFTQAMARDVLFGHIPEVEQRGYGITMRVHDELVTETPDDDRFSGEHLAQLIGRPHSWCADMPVAAVGETLYRYQK